jgi:hypothetical protein
VSNTWCRFRHTRVRSGRPLPTALANAAIRIDQYLGARRPFADTPPIISNDRARSRPRHIAIRARRYCRATNQFKGACRRLSPSVDGSQDSGANQQKKTCHRRNDESRLDLVHGCCPHPESTRIGRCKNGFSQLEYQATSFSIWVRRILWITFPDPLRAIESKLAGHDAARCDYSKDSFTVPRAGDGSTGIRDAGTRAPQTRNPAKLGSPAA